MAHDPLDHVMDVVAGSDGEARWVIFETFFGEEIYITLPKILGFQITKFMVLELIAAALILAIYIPLARRARNGELPRGAWWNCFESLLTFIRNEVARPNLEKEDHHHAEHGDEEASHAAQGHHGHAAHAPSQTDRYVPFLWTLFLFILFCNLLGMIPFAGSPTASIFVTGALALCSLIVLHGAAIAKMGVGTYFKSLWPGIEIEIPVIGPLFGLLINGLIYLIEFFGTFIKTGVLAVRLFANMFAGHMVLAMILLFIVNVGHLKIEQGLSEPDAMWILVTSFSVLGVVALSLLELFVAFLQAYIFVFLTALFMGMAMNPEH